MKDKSMEELEALNNTFLKDIGCEHMKSVCDVADAIMRKYQDIAVPKSLDVWFYGFLDERKKNADHPQRKKHIIQTSKRVVAVLVMIIGMMSIVTVSVDALRGGFFNMVLETREKFDSMFYEEEYRQQ